MNIQYSGKQKIFNCGNQCEGKIP